MCCCLPQQKIFRPIARVVNPEVKISEGAPEIHVGELLRQRGLRLAAAESCTGGLVGHLLTNVPGSSTYFVGGVVAYAYDAKVRLLGVRWETLEKYGAVSRETSLEMARGACRTFAADVAVSVTGVAGPGGGTPEKPVGTTWIAVAGPNGEEAQKFFWQGDREANKIQSAGAALRMLVTYLQY